MKRILLNGTELDFEQPIVMGILNVTPDSFFDGGSYCSEVTVTRRIHQIMEEGAEIIDLGAYSTRPGAAYVSEQDELKRLDPAMELIRRLYPKAIVSVDTFRASVVRSLCTCYGDFIVNDVSGGADKDMFPLMAELGLPYILMHTKGELQTMQQYAVYEDVVEEVRAFFEGRIGELNALGVDNIIIDPGFGFAKTLDHNYELMRGLDVLKALNYPMLVGISRKTMIWKLLGGKPENALNGTTVLNAYVLMHGANILRVHDVKEAVEAVKIIGRLI